mmetsp:Transcript_122006/g.352493  ORF Transcript_122006/g.352493 Transcript_122006/m.352493 type:complete len:228 (-) Transcript_122006:102-785(-)
MSRSAARATPSTTAGSRPPSTRRRMPATALPPRRRWSGKSWAARGRPRLLRIVCWGSCCPRRPGWRPRASPRGPRAKRTATRRMKRSCSRRPPMGCWTRSVAWWPWRVTRLSRRRTSCPSSAPTASSCTPTARRSTSWLASAWTARPHRKSWPWQASAARGTASATTPTPPRRLAPVARWTSGRRRPRGGRMARTCGTFAGSSCEALSPACAGDLRARVLPASLMAS